MPNQYFKLSGRLGNIMFQIAALESYARKYGTTPVWIHSDVSEKYNGPNSIFRKIPLKPRSTCTPRLWTGVRHDSFEYNPIHHPPQCDFWIFGSQTYFQSEKYFESPAFARSLFEMTDETMYKLCSLNPNPMNMVSIHVRRGDYVNQPHNHPCCSKDYYDKAMAVFPNSKFLVFSDDLPWARENFPGCTICDFGLTDWEELYLMSLCTGGHIIANSTFSWWGAYLDKCSNRVTVAPKQWFGSVLSTKISSKDICPPDWILL